MNKKNLPRKKTKKELAEKKILQENSKFWNDQGKQFVEIHGVIPKEILKNPQI